jgi:virulence-associated protein VagC
MKTLNIFQSRTGEITKVETSATTWGAFKQELIAKELFKGNMKAVHMQTKVTLEHDEIELPSDGSYIILVPIESKAGNRTFTVTEDQLDEFVENLCNAVEKIVTDFASDVELSAEARRIAAEVSQLLKGFN